MRTIVRCRTTDRTPERRVVRQRFGEHLTFWDPPCAKMLGLRALRPQTRTKGTTPVIPNSRPHRTRRERRVWQAATVLGTATAVTAGLALIGPSAQAANPSSAVVATDAASRERAFAAAAAEYGVPQSVLEA